MSQATSHAAVGQDFRLLPRKTSACALHHSGAVRIDQLPDGSATIEAVRIVNRRIQKRALRLSPEELGALDAALRESFGRTETAAQLSLDLPRERSAPRLMAPLPKRPSHAKPKRFYFTRRGGKREG